MDLEGMMGGGDDLEKRLKVLEEAASKAKEKQDDDDKKMFFDKYGAQFNGNEDIGTAILAQLNQMGVNTGGAAESAIMEIMNNLAEQVVFLMNNIQAIRTAVEDVLGSQGNVDTEPPAGVDEPPPDDMGMEPPMDDMGAPPPPPMDDGMGPPPMDDGMGAPPPPPPMDQGMAASDKNLKVVSDKDLKDEKKKTDKKKEGKEVSATELKDTEIEVDPDVDDTEDDTATDEGLSEDGGKLTGLEGVADLDDDDAEIDIHAEIAKTSPEGFEELEDFKVLEIGDILDLILSSGSDPSSNFDASGGMRLYSDEDVKHMEEIGEDDDWMDELTNGYNSFKMRHLQGKAS
jgi:hypothetical protein